MKKGIISVIAAAGLAAVAFDARAVSFDFASIQGATISSDGAGNFGFVDNGAVIDPASFSVTDGSAAGFLGDINGVFTIGAITTVGPTSSAPVTGSGTFIIYDGATDLTATITWLSISQTGTGNTLNVLGQVNMTSIAYAGANADLVALKNDGAAINTVTFQFTPSVSLASFKGSARSTSFSGTVTSVVPDGGLTAILLGIGFLGVAGFRRKVA